jgi:hypothetical protein
MEAKMYLDPSRQEEMFDMLDDAWKSWKEGSIAEHLSKFDLIQSFLDVMEGLGSSTDRAYIEAWHQQNQREESD